MNPWVAIVAKYGIEFAIDLARIINDKSNPTAEDFSKLKLKYGTKEADDYLLSSAELKPE